MSARRRMLSLSILGDASTCTQRSHSSSPPPDGVPAAAVVAAAIGSTLRSSIRRWPMHSLVVLSQLQTPARPALTAMHHRLAGEGGSLGAGDAAMILQGLH